MSKERVIDVWLFKMFLLIWNALLDSEIIVFNGLPLEVKIIERGFFNFLKIPKRIRYILRNV